MVLSMYFYLHVLNVGVERLKCVVHVQFFVQSSYSIFSCTHHCFCTMFNIDITIFLIRMKLLGPLK